ncbi:helix-turn-helix transcriptional regulator [Paenibacillus qinlingensis]|uniref:helix-turn-helix transcriptional regulator n=1 Tax=Paenibacillus qinlingensis TaxID=1837343 RepID=UPI0015648120|nr:AraC family transcriptional regulator [Paenibacillus qinlingensis]NQX62071.1 helix-turn-helix transcriptional regulator [Paenibacillus qinlingensis]
MNLDDLHEGRIHGDLMFPLSVYQVEKVNDVFFNYHWHEEIEFIYMTQGSACFYIGSSLTELQQGESLLIPSGQLHACYPASEFPAYFHAIVFDSHLLSSSAYDVIQSKYIQPWMEQRLILPSIYRSTDSWEQHVRPMLVDIIKQFEGKPLGYELKIKANLLAIFAELLPHGELSADLPRNAIQGSKIERIKPALQFMHEQYNQRIMIPELAGLIGMSEGHFCRFFKAIVKKTPIEYLNFYRVEKAMKCLEDPKIKIIDVASEVGFESPSYFIKTFKALKQMTPSNYRKLIRDSDASSSGIPMESAT